MHDASGNDGRTDNVTELPVGADSAAQQSQPTVSVIIPAMNEAKNLPYVAHRMPERSRPDRLRRRQLLRRHGRPSPNRCGPKRLSWSRAVPARATRSPAVYDYIARLTEATPQPPHGAPGHQPPGALALCRCGQGGGLCRRAGLRSAGGRGGAGALCVRPPADAVLPGKAQRLYPRGHSGPRCWRRPPPRP